MENFLGSHGLDTSAAVIPRRVEQLSKELTKLHEEVSSCKKEVSSMPTILARCLDSQGILKTSDLTLLRAELIQELKPTHTSRASSDTSVETDDSIDELFGKLQAGSRVQLFGLRKHCMNGLMGILSAFNESAGRWEVEMDSEDKVPEFKLIIAENLRCI